jgi:PAS domain S-box-containing protein
MEYPEKLTKAYRHPAMQGYCDFTGCKVLSPREWHVVEKDYAVGVGLMDGCVVFSLPWGRGTESGMTEYVRIMHEVFDNHLGPERRAVIIDDFSQYAGISQQARKVYIRGLKERPEIAGLVCYNLSTYFRFNLGIGRRLHLVPYPIEFRNSYEEAIVCAAKILGGPIGRVDPTKAPYAPAPDTTLQAQPYPLLGAYSADTMQVDYRRIANDVLLVHCRGTASRAGIDEIVSLRRRDLNPTFGTSQLDYVVVDIEDMSRFPLDTIAHYARLITGEQLTITTKLVVLAGDQAFTNASERFTRMRIPVQVVEAKNLNEAIAIIDCHREGSAVPVDLDLPIPEDIASEKDFSDTLVQILSKTRWDIPGAFKIAERFPPGHDMRVLLDALDTIKMDVDMMLGDQRRQLAQLAQAADIIEESEQQFRALFDVAADGILVINVHGIIVDSNPSAAMMFQTSQDGLVGEPSRAFLPALESYLGDGADKLGTGIDDVQITGRRKQGKTFPARVSLRRIEMVTGEHIIAYVKDSSESIAVQQAILDTTFNVTRSIGGDLHDSLGQKLVGAYYAAQALRKPAIERCPELTEQIASILGVLKSSIDETRTLARGLNPAEQTAGGCLNGLQRFSEEARDMYAIACSFQTDLDEAEIPPSTCVHLYHIVQESVNNAVRHGQASTVSIRISHQGVDMGLLTIKDDGGGFTDKLKGATRGMGLRLMRHRTDLIGGEFEATSHPGKGVTLRCSFALKR